MGFFDYGLGGIDATLVARYHDFPQLVLTNHKLIRSHVEYWILPLGVDQPYIKDSVDVGGGYDFPFPYLQHVLPDVH